MGEVAYVSQRGIHLPQRILDQLRAEAPASHTSPAWSPLPSLLGLPVFTIPTLRYWRPLSYRHHPFNKHVLMRRPRHA